MKLLIILILSLSYIDANEVKNNVDIASIVQTIDKIADSLKKQEEELQKRKVGGFEDQELAKIRKQEVKSWISESDYKRSKMDYLRSKQEYVDTVKKINDTDRYQLLKRMNKLSRVANGYLHTYKMKDNYVIRVKDYFTFSGNTYAYVNESSMHEVANSMSEVAHSISELEGIILLISNMKNFDTETILNNITQIEGQLIAFSSRKMNIEPTNALVNSQAGLPTTITMIKVKEGDIFNGVYVASVDASHVVVKLAR